jgi:NADH-quinone oxidoreductase subunit M
MLESDLLWMSLVIFLPSAFALLLVFFPRGSDEYMRWWSLLGTAATMVVSFILAIDFQYGVMDPTRDRPADSTLSRRAQDADAAAAVKPDDPQRSARSFSGDLVTRHPWIARFNIDYFLGLDGISMPLVLLTTVITFLAMLASWNISRYVRGYCMLLLFLETGMVGTFLALDFFLFYIFWEVMLLPMYFLIGVWGGPRREYAAIKFFLYTLLGSVFILIALLAFYFTDIRDFVNPAAAEAARERVARGAESRHQRLTEKQIQEEAKVNSFDLLALQRAGQAARQILNGESREKVARRIVIDNARMRLAPEARRRLEHGSPEQKKQEQAALEKAADDRKAVEAVEGRLNQLFFTEGFQYTMFLLLFVGFAIKVPVFPFHTWLPDAHVEAPTPISMILAGVLLKFGGYGIIRIAYPICPWAAEMLAWPVCVFAMINILYGAFAAMAQTDFKKLVAYSSVSHMGYVILGIAVWSSPATAQYWQWGMNGAMFQMIAHGITSAGMFFLVGVIYDRAHHRNLDNFRGLYEPMPLYGGISAIIFFAALGLPGMCGFVGEFMVILSTWNFRPDFFPDAGKVLAVLAALTVVITAAYILWTVQRVFLGVNAAYKDYPDINLRELITIIPLVILAVLLGVLPFLLLNMMEPHVSELVNSLAQLWR